MIFSPRLVLLLVIFFTTISKSPAQGSFPVPQKLQSHVKFWIDIYSRYSKDQYVIHDAWDVDKLYQVVDWKSPEMNDKYYSGWDAARAVRDKYAGILNDFIAGDCQLKQSISADHFRVYKMWHKSNDPETYVQALENLRIQQGLREEFKAGLRRTGRYMKQIRAIFHKYGIPPEITILPQVESCFNTKAYSRIGAAGMWQFTHYTGQLFLNVGYDVDERLDPLKASEAAAKLLRKNYDIVGSWPLAITAYNHGPLGMKRAIEQLGTDNFTIIHDNYKSPSFKFASRNFYLEFLAAKHIFENYRLYFGKVDFERPQKYIEYKLPADILLSTLTDELGLDSMAIAEMNPALRSPVLNSSQAIPKGYKLKLPSRYQSLISKEIAHLSPSKNDSSRSRWRYYRVRPGESLQFLAQRLNTDIVSLCSLNNIDDPFTDCEGMILKIPAQNFFVAQEIKSSKATKDKIEDLPHFANAISSAEEIAAMETNPKQSQGIETHASEMGPPQVVQFANKAIQSDDNYLKPSAGWTKVYPDETLGHFAAWLKVPVQKLLTINRMNGGEELHPGQRVRLLFDHVNSEEFYQLRLEYHKGIQEDFYSHYAVRGTQVHKLKKGENIWDLSNYEYEVPAWLISIYNPNKNLFNLQPGVQVIIPEIVEKKS